VCPSAPSSGTFCRWPSTFVLKKTPCQPTDFRLYSGPNKQPLDFSVKVQQPTAAGGSPAHNFFWTVLATMVMHAHQKMWASVLWPCPTPGLIWSLQLHRSTIAQLWSLTVTPVTVLYSCWVQPLVYSLFSLYHTSPSTLPVCEFSVSSIYPASCIIFTGPSLFYLVSHTKCVWYCGHGES